MDGAQNIGDFAITRPLGSGGMGSVYLAQHPQRQAPVALKVMLPSASSGDEHRRLVEREIRAMAGLRHRNIIEILDFGDLDDGSRWIAMEPCHGGDLRSHPPDNWTDLKGCLVSILDGLAHAHARGLLHRDLKPSNVLYGRASRLPEEVTIVDFGLTFDLREEQDDEQKAMGTPTYMAPEQCLGRWREFGPWTDIFAFGCLAWRLSTGHPPFRPERNDLIGLLRAQVRAAPRRFVPHFPVPPRFEAWLLTLLNKTASERPASAAAAARSLMALGDVDDRATEELAIEVTPSLVLDGIALPEVSSPALPAIRLESSSLLGVNLMPLRYRKLAGRKAERRRLNQGLAEAARGGTARIGITGDSGLGKSRLCEWLCQRVLAQGAATVLWVRNGADGGYGQGLAGALETHFLTAGLHGDELEAQIAKRLQMHRVDQPHLASSIAAMLSDHEASPTETIQIWRELLTALAANSPLVLFVEDSDQTVEQRIIAALLSCPLPGVLSVITARQAPTWWPAVDTIALKPLGASASAVLIRDMAPLEPELSTMVVRRCDGHPAFIHELLAHWGSAGVLTNGPNGWALTHEQSEVPATIGALWRQRINLALAGFGFDWRAFLATAALAGRTVDRPVLRAIAKRLKVPLIDQVIAALADAGLVQTHEHVLCFRYGLLHETLLAQLNPLEKVTAHKRIAAVLAPSDKIRHRSARLEHLTDAGCDDEALPLYAEVLRATWQGRDLDDCRRMLDRWRGVLERLDPDHKDPRWLEYVATLITSTAVGQDEGIRIGKKWLARFAATAGSHDGRIRLMMAVSNCMAERGDGENAIRLMEACVRAANETTERSLWADANQQIAGLADFGFDASAAQVHLHKAVLANKALGRQRKLASCMLTQATVLRRLDDFDAAGKAFQRSVEISTRLGNRLSVLIAHNNWGAMCVEAGELDEAAKHFQLAEEQGRIIQSPHTVIIGINRGEIMRKLGRHDEAAEVQRWATEQLIKRPNPLIEIYLLGSRAASAAAQRDRAATDEICHAAKTTIASISLTSAGPDEPWRDAAAQWRADGQSDLYQRCIDVADAITKPMG